MIKTIIEINGLEEAISSMKNSNKELPACISRATNRALEMTKTEMIRQAQVKYTIRRSKLAKSISLFKSNKSDLRGAIKSSGRTIGFNHFNLSPKKRVYGKKVKVEIIKGNQTTFNHAFIAYRDGRLGAFERTSKKKLYWNKKKTKKILRYSIKRLRSVSAPQMLGETSILEHLQGYASDKFKMRLEHEMERIIYK